MKKLRVYVYQDCDNCRKALRFLARRKIDAEIMQIRNDPPTQEELRAMLGYVGGNLRKICNTTGREYKLWGLAKDLPEMTLEKAFAVLVSNGNLIRRPFALTEKAGVVGFKEAEWEKLVAGL